MGGRWMRGAAWLVGWGEGVGVVIIDSEIGINWEIV